MRENTTPRLVLTIEETAEALTVSTRTVERLIALGELPSRKIGWRRVVPVAALERFLAEPESPGGSDVEVVVPTQPNETH